jgi:hypothetical protein
LCFVLLEVRDFRGFPAATALDFSRLAGRGTGKSESSSSSTDSNNDGFVPWNADWIRETAVENVFFEKVPKSCFLDEAVVDFDDFRLLFELRVGVRLRERVIEQPSLSRKTRF